MPSDSKEIKDTATRYSEQAIDYFFQNKFTKALDLHLKCLELLEQTNDLENLAITHFNIGEVEIELKHRERALYHFKKSVKLFLDLGLEDCIDVAKNYSAISEVLCLTALYSELDLAKSRSDNLKSYSKLDERILYIQRFEDTKKFDYAFSFCTSVPYTEALFYAAKAYRIYRNLNQIADAKDVNKSIFRFWRGQIEKLAYGEIKS